MVSPAHLHARVSALVARDRGASSGGRTEDAIGSAKLALMSVVRSGDALRSMGAPFEAAARAALIATLDDIERGLDDRLDIPVS